MTSQEARWLKDFELENERLKQQLMRESLWYAITRAIRIWRNKE